MDYLEHIKGYPSNSISLFNCECVITNSFIHMGDEERLLRRSRWGLMLSVNGPCSIVFNVEMLKILLFTVIEDFS